MNVSNLRKTGDQSDHFPQSQDGYVRPPHGCSNGAPARILRNGLASPPVVLDMIYLGIIQVTNALDADLAGRVGLIQASVLQRHVVADRLLRVQAVRNTDGFDNVDLSLAAHPDLMADLGVFVAGVL